MGTIEEKVCKAPGCSTKHKSYNDFCCEHGHLIDQQHVKPREKTFVADIMEDEWPMEKSGLSVDK